MNQLKELLLTDPETGEALSICTPIQQEMDGAYSFCVVGKSGNTWKHTIKTEEMPMRSEEIRSATTLAGELKRLRLIKAQTLREVEVVTGVSNAYLSQLENGKATEPSPRVLRVLAEHYAADYLDLMSLAGHIHFTQEIVGREKTE